MTYVPGAPTILSRVLNLVGAAAVVGSFLGGGTANPAPWIVVVFFVGLASWLVVVLSPARARTVHLVALALMAAAGALTCVPTLGLSIAFCVVAVVRLTSAPQWPLPIGITAALGSLALVPVGLAYAMISAPGLLAIEAGILVAALAGYGRRQFRISELQAAQLAEERLVIREEQGRVRVLAERQRVARDIHDVLAHSLGGLAIQLDAIEALLEAGRVDDATRRVADARELAAAGLVDARRAVEALRSGEARPDAADRADAAPAEDLAEALLGLLRKHEALGGRAHLSTTGMPRALDADESSTLQQALTEALTNARKHATGETVWVTLAWDEHSVSLDMANAVHRSPTAPHPSGLGSSGGGHGLRGMAERFALLPGGVFEVERGTDSFRLHTAVGHP